MIDRSFNKLKDIASQIIFGPFLYYLYTILIYSDVDNADTLLKVINLLTVYIVNLVKLL